MGKIFSELKKIFRKHEGAAGIAAALLLLVIFTGVMIGGLNGQKEQIPDNPVSGKEKSSMVMLTGSREVVADNTEGIKGRISEQQEQQNPESEIQDQESDSGSETENGQDSNSSVQSQEQSGNPGANTSASDASGGSAGGQGAEGTQNQDSPEPKNGESNTKKKNKKADDSGKKDTQYFRTTIENGAVVNKPDYTYEIEQLTTLEVKKIRNALNDGKAAAYHGTIKLAHGENKLLVSVTYLDETGGTFTVSKEYTLYYEPDQIVLQTNLADKTVKTDKISFRAYAQLGSEEFAVSAQVNGQSFSSDGNWNFTDLPLKEGENKIILEAQRDGQSVRAAYTVYYEKPQNQKIRFDTSLKDEEVHRKKYTFYAQAFMGSETLADVTVEVGGLLLTPVDGDNYEVLLAEGENQFTLTAGRDGLTESVQYTVTYVKQSAGEGGGEGNEDAPRVTCTLGENNSNLSTERQALTFEVYPYDYHGNALGAENVSITCFGDNGDNAVGLIWENRGDISYRATLSQGNNTMIIDVTDAEDNTTQFVYSIFCLASQEGERVGTVHISVEATTVGSGILVSQDVDIYEGETAAETLVKLLEDNGYTVDYTGTFESAFYLARINSDVNFVNGNIPEDLRKKLEEMFDPTDLSLEDFYTNSLGEFDFTSKSGWIYQVNGTTANYGLSDYCLQDGDVMRMRFTLAMGADIGAYVGDGEWGKNWGYEW